MSTVSNFIFGDDTWKELFKESKEALKNKSTAKTKPQKKAPQKEAMNSDALLKFGQLMTQQPARNPPLAPRVVGNAAQMNPILRQAPIIDPKLLTFLSALQTPRA